MVVRLWPHFGRVICRSSSKSLRMNNRALTENFAELSTPLIADAALRMRLPIRVAPVGICSLIPTARIAGGALPAKHFGSVGVFLEAMLSSGEGDILVIDNNAGTGEGGIGYLKTLEARPSKLPGFVIWVSHGS